MRRNIRATISAAVIALTGFAGLGVSGAIFQSASAQGVAQWPQRPVRLIVPLGAGGAADTLARNISNGFPQFANGHPLVVENRAGAGGTIAAGAVAREAPDGYTLLLAEVGPNAVSHVLAQLNYDPHTAFSPIIHAVNLPAAILLRQNLPYKTLEEFIEAAKKQPGKFNYASVGLGNWTHLFMSYFNIKAGIEQANVVYRSGSEMSLSLLRGDADTAIITVSTALGHIREGKIRALAGINMKPMPQLPGVPAVGKTLPGFDVAVWHGIVGPAGMDPALVTRLNGIFNQVLKDPVIRKALEEAQAAEIVGGSAEQFATFIKSELKRWPEVVKATGIKAQ